MISHMDCTICSEPYNPTSRIPRGCPKCGNNVCEMCLQSIYLKKNSYDCPFCKAPATVIWTKNLPLIHMLEENNQGGMVCQPHKKKIVSLCCSKDCKVPPGICQRADCSRVHKEYGTNIIPVSLLMNKEDEQSEDVAPSVDFLYKHFEKIIAEAIQEERKEANKKDIVSLLRKSESNPTPFGKLTSEQLSEIKNKIMSEEGKAQQAKEQLLMKRQRNLVDYLTDVVKKAKVPYEQMAKKEVRLVQSKKEEIVAVAKQNDYGFLFELITSILRQKFKHQLIFDSQKHQARQFKNSIAGRSNLLTRIELADGTVFGSYFNVQYPTRFTSDKMYHDPRAFVYWQNERTYFRAENGSKSQFDTSSDYLFSVGNTYHWDGFWFQNNLDVLNPGRSQMFINSDQYMGLSIPFSTNAVRSVKVFQLEM